MTAVDRKTQAHIESIIAAIKPAAAPEAIDALYTCQNGARWHTTTIPFQRAQHLLEPHRAAIAVDDWRWLEEQVKAEKERDRIPEIYAWIGGSIRPNQVAELALVASAEFETPDVLIREALDEKMALVLRGFDASGQAAGLRAYCVENDIEFHIQTDVEGSRTFYHFSAGIGREVEGPALRTGMPHITAELLRCFANQGVSIGEAAEILPRIGHGAISPLVIDDTKKVGNPAFPTDDEAKSAVMAALTSALAWFDEAPIDELEAVETAIEKNAPRQDIERAIAIARRAGWMVELDQQAAP